MISQRLKTARELKKLSQYKLAKLSGISKTAISLIERSERENPRATTIAALSKALNITADYLICNIDEPKKLK